MSCKLELNVRYVQKRVLMRCYSIHIHIFAISYNGQLFSFKCNQYDFGSQPTTSNKNKHIPFRLEKLSTNKTKFRLVRALYLTYIYFVQNIQLIPPQLFYNCAKPTKQDWSLFSPRNNHNPSPNLSASLIGEGPSCLVY